MQSRLPIICYRCGVPSHVIRECPQPPPMNQAPLITCYRCGVPGHMIRDCLQPPPPMNQGQARAMLGGNPSQASGNRCVHCQSWNHASDACYKVRQNAPNNNALARNGPPRGGPPRNGPPRNAPTRAIECPTDVPGLVSNMIHIEATIDGIKVNAFIDTGAAANVSEAT